MLTTAQQKVFFLSGLLMLCTAIFSVGYYHPDEHFQILEFAGYKLGITPESGLAWEYQSKMRPAFQPFIIVILYHFLDWIGLANPFNVAMLSRLLTAFFAFITLKKLYNSYAVTIQNERLRNWFLHISFLLWFLVFYSIRFSSENWSALFFLIAFAGLHHIKSKNKPYLYLLNGAALGTSFICRYQVGFLIFGLGLWLLFIKKEKRNNLLLMIAGALIPLGFGLFIDHWFYDKWILTAWNYLDQNILHNKVAEFGTHPWTHYIKEIFLRGIPPFSLVYLVSIVLFIFFKPKDAITWSIVPFLFIHQIIAHKEIRFLFPLMGFMPAIIIQSLEHVNKKWFPDFIEKKGIKLCARAFIIVSIASAVVLAFIPAQSQVSLYKKLYTSYPSKISMYTTDPEHPFGGTPTIYFYRSPNLTINVRPLQEIKDSAGGTFLFATKNPKEAQQLVVLKKLVYFSFPEWMRRFNYNGWMERDNAWYIYEVTK